MKKTKKKNSKSVCCPLGLCDGSGWITWREGHGEQLGEPCECDIAIDEARDLGWDIPDRNVPVKQKVILRETDEYYSDYDDYDSQDDESIV